MPEIYFPQKQKKFSVSPGTILMDAMRNAGVTIDAPCGGHGRCGKCRVTIQEGDSVFNCLACRYTVVGDIQVFLEDDSMRQQILDTGEMSFDVCSPNVYQIKAQISPCPIGKADSLAKRIKNTIGSGIKLPLSIVSKIYSDLSSIDYHGNFVICQNKLIRVQKNAAPLYVLAFDVGTTTIVSYLLDAESGRQVSVSSIQNPQAAYGADVISRCEYDVEDTGNMLTSLVRQALDALAHENAQKANISTDDIYFAAICGNTCMQHLFLGISPESLIHVPYIATIDELQIIPAKEVGLHINPLAEIAVLPCIAGFVGGDTVSVLLSLPSDTFEQLTLILDIGTNGELVLGKKDTLYTCSTAAGPAFEGAKISCGMRGATGAIDHAHVSDGKLMFSTIDGAEPMGICGSGLIDLIRCFLELGIVSPRGRLEKPDKWPLNTKLLYKENFIQKEGKAAFLLSSKQKEVYISQKDIREVQLAKAAIATGIEILCDTMGVSIEDIQNILLAGAFGSYMDAGSACRIGLMPETLLSKTHVIGNAAGEGAKLAALNRSALGHAAALAKDVHFVELATSQKFQTQYINHLNF